MSNASADFILSDMVHQEWRARLRPVSNSEIVPPLNASLALKSIYRISPTLENSSRPLPTMEWFQAFEEWWDEHAQHLSTGVKKVGWGAEKQYESVDHWVKKTLNQCLKILESEYIKGCYTPAVFLQCPKAQAMGVDLYLDSRPSMRVADIRVEMSYLLKCFEQACHQKINDREVQQWITEIIRQREKEATRKANEYLERCVNLENLWHLTYASNREEKLADVFIKDPRFTQIQEKMRGQDEGPLKYRPEELNVLTSAEARAASYWNPFPSWSLLKEHMESLSLNQGWDKVGVFFNSSKKYWVLADFKNAWQELIQEHPHHALWKKEFIPLWVSKIAFDGSLGISRKISMLKVLYDHARVNRFSWGSLESITGHFVDQYMLRSSGGFDSVNQLRKHLEELDRAMKKIVISQSLVCQHKEGQDATVMTVKKKKRL